MDRICSYFKAQDTSVKEMDFDGYRIEFRDWWFNIRPSNTEPYLRFICEASDGALLEAKIKEAQQVLEDECGGTRV